MDDYKSTERANADNTQQLSLNLDYHGNSYIGQSIETRSVCSISKDMY